jgi:hypothetical protein
MYSYGLEASSSDVYSKAPWKCDYTEAEAYRPISLSSFLLKTMETLMDRHIRDCVLQKHPVHQNQHAYQIGKATAIHNVVTGIKSVMKYKEIAQRAFLATEGSFGRTSFDVITQAAERHGTEQAFCRWISCLLKGRNIITTLAREILRASAARGCTQGGVLSPLLWSLVMDEFLWDLNDNDYCTEGYADDISILINRKFPHTVSGVYKEHYA